MKIIDEQNLIPDKRILIQIISNHPFVSDLSNKLETVQIEISENHGIPKEMIQFDPSNTHVILGIGKGSHQKENFEYILYHEFGHAADRLNPGFEYSEKEKSLLSAKEKMGVMELWNTYIDSRLNESGLFKLGYQPPSTGKLNGKVALFASIRYCIIPGILYIRLSWCCIGAFFSIIRGLSFSFITLLLLSCDFIEDILLNDFLFFV